MTIEEIKELIASGNIKKCKDIFELHCIGNSLLEVIKQYNPEMHDVMNKAKRRDKKVTDNENKVTKVVEVARIPLAIQKNIVTIAAAFLGTPKMQAMPSNDVETNLYAGLNKVWDKNKLDYKFKTIAKTAMSERECAELWYTQTDTDKSFWDGTHITSDLKLRLKLLAPKFGDCLYPVYDDYGDMIAFGRYYKIKTASTDKEYFDIYTADTFYFNELTNGSWITSIANTLGINTGTNKGIPNPVGKIPVIYYRHPIEWEDVQHMIDRLEVIFSKLADTNDYSGSPIMVGTGRIKQFADKGDAGKYVELEGEGAKLEYLTYDSSPESIKLEIDNLQKWIYSLTFTPDISFENLKNLGYFSTIALKTMFMQAQFKAADKEEIFGEGLQRRINYLKKAIVTIDNKLKAGLPMQVKPKFTFFLPENIPEELKNINDSLNAGIMSQETAVKLNPLVSDSSVELEQIKAEDAAKSVPSPTPLPIA